MRAWSILLGGLAVWAVHFFVLYGVGSVLPGRSEARWLVLGLTLPALAVDAMILRKTIWPKDRTDPLDRWILQLGATGASVSLVAVVWQSVPALIP